jgi:tetratricopeptide (TPR) repeat protein
MKPYPSLAARLLTAALVSLAAGGCQTMKPTSDSSSDGRPPNTTAVGSANSKTDFHREVGPEQEFNVHVELARFHESQGNHEAAVAEYQKAADVCERKGSMLSHSKLGPAQEALAQRRMAAAYDRLGRFTQAETHYLKALRLTPTDPKVWNDAGYSYYMQNRLADAERSFKQCESLEPGNPRVLTNLGLTLAAQGRDEEALSALCRAGGPAVGHANMGYILAAMGKGDLAREQYKASINLQPELVEARKALAQLDAKPEAPAAATATALASANPVTPPTPSLDPKAAPVRVSARTAPVKDPTLTRAAAVKPSAAAPFPLIPLPVLPPPPVNRAPTPTRD